jgi:hypothetical protein
MYKQWLDNAISNESIMVLVAILNNSIQCFVTLHQQAIHSTIGLIVVSKKTQGAGYKKKLIHSVNNAIPFWKSTLYNPTKETNIGACVF